MPAERSQSVFALNAIRQHVRLLIATILALSIALIGYIYWYSDQRHELEEVASRFHSETMLYCTRIKEEALRIRLLLTDRERRRPTAEGQSRSHSDYANATYVLEQHIEAINQLHGTWANLSDTADRFAPIIRKVNAQLAKIKATFGESQVIGMAALVTSKTSPLGAFEHSIEQLRRLHSIVRGEIDDELDAMESSGAGHLVTIFLLALLLGLLVAHRVMGAIRHLMEQQSKTESRLRQSATVFENASEGVVITDAEANIVATNRAFTTITGYREREALGKNPSFLKSGRHDQHFYESLWSSLLQDGEWRGEIWGRRKNGEIFPKLQTISAVRDAYGRLTNYVSVFSDISQIKESEQQLHNLAHHDALTGLPNRLLLNARQEHSLQHARRQGTNVAVLFLDLDHFKKVNDSLGHPAGDRLLQLVADRLLATVREEDTIARLGGDELTIVLESLDDAGYAGKVAEKILTQLSKPFELEGREVFVSASIGISLYPQNGRDATALLKNADTAMYIAKSEGRNGYHFYSKDLSLRARESFDLESNLYRALEREEFLLHFQPQVSMQSGNIVGMEALVRWRHPEIGLVSPARFIPLAEENGLIGVIGNWVLHTACAQAKAWQNAGITPFRIAVNLSGRQLEQKNIAREVSDVLQATGLDPAFLELELTESSVMKKADRAERALDALRELGTTIAIDDFGTGYSSLSYLKRLPVDRLKIDRSFIHDIPDDPNDVALAKAIIALGRSLNLSVVAEGVETEAQRELLTTLGCDEMQGFLYSPPKAANELQDLLSIPLRSACIND